MLMIRFRRERQTRLNLMHDLVLNHRLPRLHIVRMRASASALRRRPVPRATAPTESRPRLARERSAHRGIRPVHQVLPRLRLGERWRLCEVARPAAAGPHVGGRLRDCERRWR